MAGLLPILALAAATTLLPGELASRVDEDRLIRSVRLLSGADPIDGEHLTSRHIEHPHCRLAGEWLEQEFDELPSLELRREVFDVAGADDVFNVIAELPARVEPAEGVLVLGAHYDSTASLDEGWDPSSSPAPGADDNASGVAAILEVARLLSEWEGGFAWDVRFVAFSAEEEGLLGSFHHVEQLSGPVDLALILDPVGFNPGDTDLLWFSYDTGSVAARDALEESAAAVRAARSRRSRGG